MRTALVCLPLVVAVVPVHSQDAASLIAAAVFSARRARTWVTEGKRTVEKPGEPAHSTQFELWYVDRDGFAGDIRVTRSTGAGLDEPAIEA